MGGGHHKVGDPRDGQETLLPVGDRLFFVSLSLVFIHPEKSLTESEFILVNMTMMFFRIRRTFIKCIV